MVCARKHENLRKKDKMTRNQKMECPTTIKAEHNFCERARVVRGAVVVTFGLSSRKVAPG